MCFVSDAKALPEPDLHPFTEQVPAVRQVHVGSGDSSRLPVLSSPPGALPTCPSPYLPPHSSVFFGHAEMDVEWPRWTSEGGEGPLVL